MILGMTTFTVVHMLAESNLYPVGVSGSGRNAHRKPMNSWTLLFLATTLATSLTGLLFPLHGFTPALGVGVLSIVILAATIAARYAFHLAGAWRWVYVVGAVVAL